MGVFKRWIKSKDGKNTPYWYIRFAMNGKMKWESAGKVGLITKTVAQARLEKRKRQVRLGEFDMVIAKIPIASDFIPEYIYFIREVKKNRSHDRSRQALDHFSKLYGDKKLNEITPEDIDNYKQIRLNECAALGTIARELVVIRHFFNQARKWKRFLGENPVSQSGIPKVNDQKERVISYEEEERLLSLSPKHLKDIIVIALNTGMRQGEILGLKWEWIDLEENIITLPQTNTKNNKIRKIPINKTIKSLLLERKLISAGSEFIFPSPKGKIYHLNWIKHSFKTACKNAGIENLRFHDLRHTCATRIVESRIPLHALTKLLGHSSVRVTERYSHPEESVREAVEILGNFGKDYSNYCSNDNSEQN